MSMKLSDNHELTLRGCTDNIFYPPQEEAGLHIRVCVHSAKKSFRKLPWYVLHDTKW